MGMMIWYEGDDEVGYISRRDISHRGLSHKNKKGFKSPTSDTHVHV